jgi:hypothetical protein
MEKEDMVSRKEKVNNVKRFGVLGVLVVMCLIVTGQAEATIVADLVADYMAGGWPANPFPDDAGGSWTIIARSDAGPVIPLGGDYWPQHPLRGTPTPAYDLTPGDNTPVVGALSLFNAEFLAALPWNTDGQPGASETRILIVWTSGGADNINLSGAFRLLGDQGSSAQIIQVGLGSLLPEVILTPGAPEVPFNLNTTVNPGSQIVFSIGTGINQYTGWDDETLFNVTIIPEPATVGLLGLGSIVMLLKRKA